VLSARRCYRNNPHCDNGWCLVTKAQCSSSSYYFPCSSERSFWCDGYSDCPDRSDESRCNISSTNMTTIPASKLCRAFAFKFSAISYYFFYPIQYVPHCLFHSLNALFSFHFDSHESDGQSSIDLLWFFFRLYWLGSDCAPSWIMSVFNSIRLLQLTAFFLRSMGCSTDFQVTPRVLLLSGRLQYPDYVAPMMDIGSLKNLFCCVFCIEFLARKGSRGFTRFHTKVMGFRV